MQKSKHYRDRAREILAREVGFVQKPHRGRLRVALAFPNTYFVGMSSLGFQTVYRLFNALDEAVCERVFLPPKQELQAQLASGAPLLTLESQTPVREFDILAFSVSFEWDYTNVVSMLRLAGLPPRAARRRQCRRLRGTSRRRTTGCRTRVRSQASEAGPGDPTRSGRPEATAAPALRLRRPLSRRRRAPAARG